MKKFLLFIAVAFASASLFGQSTIAYQSFEGGGDNWSYIANPSSYNISSDTWDIVTGIGSLTTLPSDGTKFWGIKDLNNPNGGGNFFHILTFGVIDVSSYTNVVMSFDYEAFEFDTGDDIAYEAFFDGTGQGEVLLVDGASNLSANGTVTINVNPGTISAYIILKAKQDGGGDYGGFDNVKLTGTPAGPTIVTAPSLLSNLDYGFGSGPSPDDVFDVSGTNLTADIVITPSTNFEISLVSGVLFNPETSIDLTPDGSGAVAATNVYVRLKAGLAINSYSESIPLTSTGATTKNVACSGDVLGPQLSVSSNSLSGMTYIVGSGPSNEETFDVSGLYLSANLDITPSTNYEISTASGVLFVATNPITLTPDINGAVTTQTIYVRLKASLPVATYNGENIVVSSTGATSENISCDGEVTNIPPALPNAWINEIHYDNTSGDVNEVVEVVIENIASYSASDFTITLYNGNGGASYGSKALNHIDISQGTQIVDGSSTFDFYYWLNPSSGIQNGAPDGVALTWDDNGTIHTIEFLSYEGSFTATNGPASGLTSVDIGEVELGTASVGTSISKIDPVPAKQSTSSSYVWLSGVTATPGAANTAQTFIGSPLPVQLVNFSASSEFQEVLLYWRTASELNSSLFDIQRSINGIDYESISKVKAAGNSNKIIEYNYIDKTVESGQIYYYRLNMIDFDGSSEYSPVVTHSLQDISEKDIELFPNPTNGILHIEGAQVDDQVEVYNIAGKNVYSTIISESNTINLDHLPKGIYFATITTQDHVISRKIIIE